LVFIVITLSASCGGPSATQSTVRLHLDLKVKPGGILDLQVELKVLKW
jgi:hypothetical protein